MCLHVLGVVQQARAAALLRYLSATPVSWAFVPPPKICCSACTARGDALLLAFSPADGDSVGAPTLSPTRRFDPLPRAALPTGCAPVGAPASTSADAGSRALDLNASGSEYVFFPFLVAAYVLNFPPLPLRLLSLPPPAASCSSPALFASNLPSLLQGLQEP